MTTSEVKQSIIDEMDSRSFWNDISVGLKHDLARSFATKFPSVAIELHGFDAPRAVDVLQEGVKQRNLK